MNKFPGVKLEKIESGWKVIIPDQYKEGHEAHFARVTQNFLDYFYGKPVPSWEIPNLISKYYTTTQALEISKRNK